MGTSTSRAYVSRVVTALLSKETSILSISSLTMILDNFYVRILKNFDLRIVCSKSDYLWSFSYYKPKIPHILKKTSYFPGPPYLNIV